MIDPDRVQEVFLKVIDRPETERELALADECGSNEELRIRIVELLRAHDSSGEFDFPASGIGEDHFEMNCTRPSALENGIEGQTADFQNGIESGEVIGGRYTLQQRIGQGGMGEVWVAKQSRPIKRKVALKVIKTGMDSRAVLERFEQERQALAMMDHPNIARVLDAGMAQSGQPFFAMELVKGLPLDKYCDETRLTLNKRLELFIPVCHAVQHAHQKGIVHRDLKPANILITLVDGSPVPKVIDFGVAKATCGKLTEQTIETQFGAVVGTLEYMSPEQAGISADDVDTRADIYSLGVILYELLTGLRPIDGQRLRKAGFAEMMRIIKEEEPSKPSTKLSTNESLSSLAAIRQTDPKKLVSVMRGELDWIVLKCLEKSRDRRYETANGLAREIEHYLDDEPVEAKPPTLRYRMSKFARRNKGPLIAASLLGASLVAGLAGTTWGLFEAKRQTRYAIGREVEAQRQKELANQNASAAELAQKQAEARAEQLLRGNDMIASIFDDLNPEISSKFDEPLESVLAGRLINAARELDGDSIADPLIVATLQKRLGDALVGLGHQQEAIALLENCVGTLEALPMATEKETLRSKSSLASAYVEAGEFRKAVTLHRELTEGYLKEFGSDDPETLTSIHNFALALYEAGDHLQAQKLLEEMEKAHIRKFGDDNLETLAVQDALATVYGTLGEYDEAIEMRLKVLKTQTDRLAEDHPRRLVTLNNLAVDYGNKGDFENMLPLIKDVLLLRKQRLGKDHPDTLASMKALAGAYHRAGRLPEAIPIFEQNVELTRKKLGEDHPDTLHSIRELAQAYLFTGDNLKAIPILEKALRSAEDRFGTTSLQSLQFNVWLSEAFVATGNLQEAESQAKTYFEGIRSQLGDSHIKTSSARTQLANIYSQRGKLAKATALLEQSLALQSQTLGRDNRSTWNTMQQLARTYYRNGEIPKAMKMFEEVLRRKTERLGRSHPDTIVSLRDIGVAYARSFQEDKAIGCLEEANQLLKERFGDQNLRVLRDRSNIGRTYRMFGRLKKAKAIFANCLTSLQEPQNDHHPLVLTSFYELASAKLLLSETDEAIEMLEDGLARCRKHLEKNDAITNATVFWLASAYRNVGRYPDSIQLFESILETRKTRLGSNHEKTKRTINELAITYLEANKLKEAEVTIRQNPDLANDKDDAVSFTSRSILARILAAQEKVDEAEPLLLSSYEGMKRHFNQTEYRLKTRSSKCLECLIAMYQSKGDRDSVERWQKELDSIAQKLQPK